MVSFPSESIDSFFSAQKRDIGHVQDGDRNIGNAVCAHCQFRKKSRKSKGSVKENVAFLSQFAIINTSSYVD